MEFFSNIMQVHINNLFLSTVFLKVHAPYRKPDSHYLSGKTMNHGETNGNVPNFRVWNYPFMLDFVIWVLLSSSFLISETLVPFQCVVKHPLDVICPLMLSLSALMTNWFQCSIPNFYHEISKWGIVHEWNTFQTFLLFLLKSEW